MILGAMHEPPRPPSCHSNLHILEMYIQPKRCTYSPRSWPTSPVHSHTPLNVRHICGTQTCTPTQSETRPCTRQTGPNVLHCTTPAPPRLSSSSTHREAHGLVECWSTSQPTRPMRSTRATRTCAVANAPSLPHAARPCAAAFARAPNGALEPSAAQGAAPVATRRSASSARPR